MYQVRRGGSTGHKNTRAGNQIILEAITDDTGKLEVEIANRIGNVSELYNILPAQHILP